MFLFEPIFILSLVIVLFFVVPTNYRKKLVFIYILSFYFFSNGFIINRIASLWETNGIKIENVEPAFCGILLSGSFKYDKQLNRLIANEDTDRLWQTVQLYKSNKIQKILLCGQSENIPPIASSSFSSIKSILIQMGVNQEDIIEESNSLNTYENAVECKKILLKNNYASKKHLLITSSLHMKRAKACFDRQGVITSPFATSQINASSTGFKARWLIPETGNLIIWNKLLKEFIGFAGYNLLGYL